MKNTAIIIPTRLGAKRFPNKPLAKINNVPMIIHVVNRAKESKVGEVLVATPDNEICKVVRKNGGKAILIDVEDSRIVVVNTIHYNNDRFKYDHKKLLINPIKHGKESFK